MSQIGLPSFQSIPAGTTGLTSGALLDNGVAKSDHSLFVVSTGTNTAGMVTLELSNDGVNWAATAANGGAANLPAAFSTGVAGVYAVSIADFPAQYVRAAITTAITGGTGVTAYVASA